MSTTWVDTETGNIPARNTWHTLDDISLMKIKDTLLNRLYIAGSNPAYAVPLRRGVDEIDAILMERLNKPAGS